MELKSPPNTTGTNSQDPLSNREGLQGYGSEDSTKSYTCAFCKRGFSNAQALGGHMNIHRKDRARLRESSSPDEEIATETTTKNSTTTSLDQTDSTSCSQEKIMGDGSLKRTWKKDEFVSDSYEEKNSSMSEVDLELRLGIDSKEASRKRIIKRRD